jgi:hypothetical protein
MPEKAKSPQAAAAPVKDTPATKEAQKPAPKADSVKRAEAKAAAREAKLDEKAKDKNRVTGEVGPPAGLATVVPGEGGRGDFIPETE